MSEKSKNILLGVLVVGLVSMTVAYAALTQTLNINGSAKVQNVSTSWNVHFKALTSGQAISTTGYASVPNNAALQFNEAATLVTLPEVTLKAPGDKVTFKWTVENAGEINAKLTGITPITKGNATWGTGETLDSTGKATLLDKINVTFTYANGNAFAANTDTLASGATTDVMVTIELDSSATTLPSQDLSLSGITAALTYGQDVNS